MVFIKGKYKIAVYAICKNESKNIEKWYQSMKEADVIYVLDTGSTDNSIDILKKYPNVIVNQDIIFPWRFDVARNKSLSYVDDKVDICVCTDFDEVFNKGWRKLLEERWLPDTTSIRYTYNWDFDNLNRPTLTFLLNKIHKRHGFSWKHIIHEYVEYNGIENVIYIPEIILNHFQDKKKPRNNYLSLLEQAVNDNPNDFRDIYLLGREYLVYKRYHDAIKMFNKYLFFNNQISNEEVSIVMNLLASSYMNLNDIENAIKWYKKAITTLPKNRNSYYDLAVLYFNNKDYNNSYIYLKEAIKIFKEEDVYTKNSNCWNEIIYDYLSITAFNLKKYEESYNYSLIAFLINPNDERIKENYNIILNNYKKYKGEL